MTGLVHPHLDSLLSLPRGSHCEEAAHSSFSNTCVLIAEPCRRLDHFLPSLSCNDSPLSQSQTLALGSGPSVLSALADGPTCLRCVVFPKAQLAYCFLKQGPTPKTSPPPWRLPCHPIHTALSWQPRLTLGHAAPQPCSSHRLTRRPLQHYTSVSLIPACLPGVKLQCSACLGVLAV